jgi:cation transport protein ChaC
MEELWVFGYGSLMWRPGFDFVEQRKGRVHGLHRRLCIYSHVHRGTPERPGLVLGLDLGGSCEGIVFRVADEKREDTIRYLREREMMNGVYYESYRRVTCEDGSIVRALTYCAQRNHVQFAPKMSLENTVAQIEGALGQSGPNEEYVLSTVDQIKDMGACDKRLEEVAKALRR